MASNTTNSFELSIFEYRNLRIEDWKNKIILFLYCFNSRFCIMARIIFYRYKFVIIRRLYASLNVYKCYMKWICSKEGRGKKVSYIYWKRGSFSICFLTREELEGSVLCFPMIIDVWFVWLLTKRHIKFCNWLMFVDMVWSDIMWKELSMFILEWKMFG